MTKRLAPRALNSFIACESCWGEVRFFSLILLICAFVSICTIAIHPLCYSPNHLTHSFTPPTPCGPPPAPPQSPNAATSPASPPSSTIAPSKTTDAPGSSHRKDDVANCVAGSPGPSGGGGREGRDRGRHRRSVSRCTRAREGRDEACRRHRNGNHAGHPS